MNTFRTPGKVQSVATYWSITHLLYIMMGSIYEIYCQYEDSHERILANNIDLGGGGKRNRPWVLETLIYEGVNLKRGGKIDLNQSLIHIHPFPPLKSQFFISPSSKSVAKKLFLGRKNIGGPFAPPPPKLPL
jgi:hypothetical protein